MTEIEQLKQDLADLRRLVIETRLPDDQIVGAEYVAALFDCSVDAVIRKRFGTAKIRRVRLSPVGFRKADVHTVLKDLTRPARDIAAQIVGSAKTRKRSNNAKQ